MFQSYKIVSFGFWGIFFIDVKWVFDFVNKCWFGFLNISNQLNKYWFQFFEDLLLNQRKIQFWCPINFKNLEKKLVPFISIA
jgi:hypothetical protein